MSIRLTLLSLLLCGAAAANPLSEADLATAAALRDQALEGSPAFAVVESLTREVGHRMAGSENDAKGRAWAVAKFRELGFQRVYVQPVKFPVWERGFESAGILSPTPAPLTIAALGGSIGTPPGGLRGEGVRFETAADLDAAPRGSLRGKIAYIANRMQRARRQRLRPSGDRARPGRGVRRARRRQRGADPLSRHRRELAHPAHRPDAL